MGIYLNPGNENFREIAGKGIYVDKTMMIAAMNHIMDQGNKYVCVSRPRRFGKTIAGNMLSAYYAKGCDSRELFAPYKISKVPGFEEKLNRFNVIKIDMNSEYQNAVDKDGFLQELVREIILDAGPLAPFSGFTAQEVQELCGKHGMSYEECRRWYDGYRQNGYEIYNPESVVISMDKKVYGSYWGQTSSYEAISDRIRMNFAGTKDAVIRMLAGEAVDVNVTRYLNTMTSFKTRDDLFTYLIHLGYLAYSRGYGNEGTCRIPNWEVEQEWMNAIAQEEDYAATNRIIEASKELLARTPVFLQARFCHPLIPSRPLVRYFPHPAPRLPLLPSHRIHPSAIPCRMSTK